jgi:formylglycine-generating enzyme required for sulfatase activity
MSTFISYSRADSGFAVRLAKDLKAAGYDIWLDQLDIPTGTRWDDEVEIALESCSTFMIVLSPESLQSQNVKDETGYAIDSGKNILPVKIKSGDIPFRLRRFQYVDFSNQSYADSLKEIKSILSVKGQLLTPGEVAAKSIDTKTLSQKTTPVPRTYQTTIIRPSPKDSPPVKKSKSRGLMIGVAVVALLTLAGIILNTVRTSKPSIAAIPSIEPTVVKVTATKQPTIIPPSDTAQVALLNETGPSENFLTKFEGNQDLEDWEPFVKGLGSRSQVTVSPSDTGLGFNLDDKDLHAYYMYKPVTYKDAIIRIKVENLGQNSNIVGMVCRRTGDTWYELSIIGGGEWKLYKYEGEYLPLTNGGTNLIKLGKNINEYEMHCTNNDISLLINGQLVTTYNIKKNPYTEGQVGFSVSTGTVFPIDIRLLEFEVSQATSELAAVDETPIPVTGGTDSPSNVVNSMVSAQDDMKMVFVPAGEFTMGSDTGEVNERPAHTVSLDAFWIDQTEVTNRMFAAFLNSKKEAADELSTWFDVGDKDLRIRYVDDSWQVDPGFEDQPFIEVKWFGASAYCEWRGDGTRLPTEAEWEKAARGTTSNLYPWGNQIDCNLANYGECVGSAVKIGNYPGNASPFGALDMAGNVMEWVADWYGENYYVNSPSANPQGPESGQDRVVRGGSWDGSTEDQVRVTYRHHLPPDDSKDDGGFRCARGQ